MSNESEDRESQDLEIMQDRIVKRLLENSALTPIQFETLVLNFYLDEKFGTAVKYEDKSRLRRNRSFNRNRTPVKKRGVTKGAFRRVLGQAGGNVIKSIYTLVLLAYVGLLDTPSLQAYVRLSEMIQSYLNELRTTQGTTPKREIQEHLIMLEQRLVNLIDEYAEPFKPTEHE